MTPDEYRKRHEQRVAALCRHYASTISEPVVCITSGQTYANPDAAADAMGGTCTPGGIRYAVRTSMRCAGHFWTTPADLPTFRPSISGGAKPVKRLDTGEVFPSANAAAKSIGRTRGAVTVALKRGTTCVGTKWAFVESWNDDGEGRRAGRLKDFQFVVDKDNRKADPLLLQVYSCEGADHAADHIATGIGRLD